MKRTPLGSLAYTILEEYGDVVRAAVDDAVIRTRAGLTPDVQCDIYGRVYDVDAAHQPLLTGNWVALGEVAATSTPMVQIDVHIATGEIRERHVTHLPEHEQFLD